MTLIPHGARATAESTLTETATVTRPTEGTFDPGTGQFTPGTPLPVWAGCCSTSPPTREDRTDTIGDDRIIGALIARIPTCPTPDTTHSGNPRDVTVGDTITIAGVDHVVRVINRRTTEVLRRLLVTEITDAEQVPK